jgi:hypothetical protein
MLNWKTMIAGTTALAALAIGSAVMADGHTMKIGITQKTMLAAAIRQLTKNSFIAAAEANEKRSMP